MLKVRKKMEKFKKKIKILKKKRKSINRCAVMGWLASVAGSEETLVSLQSAWILLYTLFMAWTMALHGLAPTLTAFGVGLVAVAAHDSLAAKATHHLNDDDAGKRRGAVGDATDDDDPLGTLREPFGAELAAGSAIGARVRSGVAQS